MDPLAQKAIFRKFTLAISIFAVLIALVPFVVGLIGGGPSTTYLGSQYNTDDHMVYAGWMQQAMEGRVFFENRFTADPQPGLTVHLYFLILGWIAKVIGVIFAATLGRLVFTFLSVFALGRLLERVDVDTYTRKLALSLAVFGGGIGFLVWHTFGRAITHGVPPFLTDLLLGFQTIDVWQPEAMFFSSMLTNGLFMVSLFLILVTLITIIDCRENPKVIVWGALAFGILMNIHSYDVLLVALALLGFLISSISSKHLTKVWTTRTLLICAGVIPAALWFIYILKVDPVFQARASTLTYTSNFRTLLGAIFPSWILAIIGVSLWPAKSKPFALAGAAILFLVPLVLAVGSTQHLTDSYYLSGTVFFALLAVIYAANYLLATEDATRNLIFAWASVSIIAPYFPGLFQRKLGMMMLVPWAILAAFGLAAVLQKQERSVRNLVTALCLLCFSATSIRWLVREIGFIRSDVSNTTVHSVYLGPDVIQAVQALQTIRRDAIVLAPPGIPSAAVEESTQKQIPDQFLTPIICDLNSIMVGLAGVRAYAGHWSETPNYNSRRAKLQKFYFSPMSPEDRKEILRETGATHFIALKPEAIAGSNFPDLSSLGTRLTEGARFQLYKVNP